MFSFFKNCLAAIFGRKWGWHRLLKPVVMHLTLTDKCNLRCSMCNIWRKEQKTDISMDLMREIASSRYGRNISVLDLTGGEPFLADIRGVVDAFDCNSLRLVLVSTNGVATRAIVETIERLLDRGSYTVHLSISLDGGRKYHDEVRGVQGTYDRVERTILALGKLQAGHQRLRVGVKMTLMPDSVDEIIPVYEFAVKHGLSFTAKPADVFEFLDNRGMEFSFSDEQTAGLCEVFERILHSERSRSMTGATFWERVYHASNILFHEGLVRYMSERNARQKQPAPPAPCLSSFLSIMVHTDGSAYSCPTLMKPIGSVEKEGFDRVWNSRAMRDTRSFISCGKCSCFSQCDQMPSLMMTRKTRLMWLVLQTYIPRLTRRKTCMAYEN